MEKNLVKGQWLFTCAMQPKQFSHYNPRNPEDYVNDVSEVNEDLLESFKYDDFETLEGSTHSQRNCGCSPISEEYAKWFIENKVDQLYDKNDPDEERWENYENRIKKLCAEHLIKYEGY